MESILRALAVYGFLLLVFRICGKRSLSDITTFDFIVLLILAETTGEALPAEDFSLTNCFLLIATLMGIDLLLSEWKQHHPTVDKVLDGVPLVLVEDGRCLEDRMAQSRVSRDDLLAAARQTQGLSGLDQVRYAVLERSGDISIIPRD